MDIEGYYQQLQALNQMLEQDLEENERAEMLDLKQNIEELLSLTKELDKKPTPEEVTLKTEIKEVDMKIENEYALFMAELAKEGSLDIKNENSRNDNQSIVMKKYSTIPKNIMNFKTLEGKKFRAPHKHQWGQVVYHNAMVCFVPDEIPANNEFEVKVLFLNPTHKEMQPCPYYFHSEKDCHYSEEECRFSHGELVPFSSLEQYIEPKFELLAVGSDVLAKQSNDLWYRAKITHISKETCLVKFDSKNVENQNFEEVVFAHILPLETESGSDNASVNDSDIEDEDFEMQIENDCLEAKLRREELINTSLMNIPENQPLGDWEKYTKGIGSKLMQKMGYIVGTGLGKKGAGIIKPVTAIILPQGKSLDYCMNLKEKRNNPNLFNADHKASKSGRKEFKRTRREEKTKRKSERRVERMDIGKFLRFRFSFNKDCRPFTEEKEYELVRKKLKDGTDKNLNVANFVVEAKLKEFNEVIFKLKTSIRQAEELHTDTKKLHERLCNREYDVKHLSTYLVLVKNEIGRRKNNKEMSVF